MTAYDLSKICYLIQFDLEFRRRILDDPQAAIEQFQLNPEERLAFLSGDVGALHALGVHPLLLLRLQRYGVVGLTQEQYMNRMRRRR